MHCRHPPLCSAFTQQACLAQLLHQHASEAMSAARKVRRAAATCSEQRVRSAAGGAGCCSNRASANLRCGSCCCVRSGATAAITNVGANHGDGPSALRLDIQCDKSACDSFANLHTKAITTCARTPKHVAYQLYPPHAFRVERERCKRERRCVGRRVCRCSMHDSHVGHCPLPTALDQSWHLHLRSRLRAAKGAVRCYDSVVRRHECAACCLCAVPTMHLPQNSYRGAAFVDLATTQSDRLRGGTDPL